MATGLDAQSEIFASNPDDRPAFEALEETLFLEGDWEGLVEVYRSRITALETAGDDVHRAPLLLRLGQILEERILDPEAAGEVYWTLARLDPTDPRALRQLRRIHESDKKWDLVLQIAELESATTMPPHDRAAFEADLARVWQRGLDDADEAHRAFERALEAEADFPAALEGLADLHREAGRHEDAAALLTRLTQRLRGPERAPSWIALGTLYATELDRKQHAKECFEQALDDDPLQPAAVEWLLLIASEEEDWETVSELLDRRFDLASGARHRAAIAVEASQIQLKNLGSSEKAHAWADRALELSGEETSVLLALAEIERAEGDRPALLGTLEKLISIRGDAASRACLLETAELHHHFGNSEAALETSLRASQRPGDDDLRLLTLRATLLRDAGSNRELAEVLETLTSFEGGVEDEIRAGQLCELALLQENDLSDEQSARSSWQRAYALDPSGADVIAALERIHSKAADWDALKAHFEASLDATEGADRAALSTRLGMLLLERFDDPEQARSRFETTLSILPDSRPAIRGLRQVAEQTGDRELLLDVCNRELKDCGDSGQIAELARVAIPILEDSDRTEDALEWAMHWSKAEPNSRDALTIRARFQQELERVEDEIESLRKLAKLLSGPERAESLCRQARLHLEQEDLASAQVALEHALEEGPGQPEMLRTLCHVYRALRKAQPLAKTLRMLIEGIPRSEHAESLEELAEILQDPIGDADAAIVIRWQLADLPSAPDDATEKLAALLESTGRYAELAQVLDTRRQQVGDESDEAFALDLRRAEVLLDSLGHCEDAAEILSTLHDRHPDNEVIVDQLERALRVGNDARGLCELIEHRAEWETDEPKKVAMRLECASLLGGILGEPHRAADLYEEIIRDHVDSQDASLRLELLLESSEQWERLRNRLVGRVEDLSNEKQATIRERIAAICLDQLNDIAGCAEQLEAIAEIIPDRGHVWQKLAELYIHDLDRPADWLRITEAELDADPAEERELSLRVAAARLLLDDDRRPADRDVNGAYTHYERVMAILPTHAEAAEVLAMHFTAEARHADTIRILEARLEGLSESGGAEVNDIRLRLAGMLSNYLGEHERARTFYEAVQAELGASARVAEPLADLYEHMHLFDDLRVLCRESIGMQTNDAETLRWRIRLGRSERHCGNLEDAVAAYRTALIASPNDRDIENALIDLYGELEEFEPLADLLEKRLPYAREEEVIDLRLRLARLDADHRDNPREALDHLIWILDSHPQHRDAFDLALEIVDRTGEPEQILIILDRALDASLPSVERSLILERRGLLLADSLERPEQAVASFREAIALDRQNSTAQRALRRVLEELDRWPAVLDCLYLEAAEADPEHRIELFEKAAEIASSRVNPDASLPWLARLRAERPEDPEIPARLAEVHRRAGRFQAALRAYEEELTLISDPSREYLLHVQRGRLLERELHAPGRAILAYLEAAEIAEDDREVLAELDRLYDSMGRTSERANVLETRVDRADPSEAIELRQSLAALYCVELVTPDLAVPHLEANVAAVRGDARRELQHLRALGAALRAGSHHDDWIEVAERELELIASDDEILEDTRDDYRRFLRVELARSYDQNMGAPDRAIECLRTLETEAGQLDQRCRSRLRDLYRRTGRVVELAASLSLHLESDEGTPIEWLELGRLREEKLVDLTGAIDAYRHAEVRCLDPLSDPLSDPLPDPLPAIRGRRRCCERLRDWPGVAEALESEYHQESDLDERERTAIARQLGDVCWHRLAASERAIDAYRLALDLDPNDLSALRCLITVTEASRPDAEIVPLYLRELDLLSDDPSDLQRRREVWLCLATIYCDCSESHGDAIAAYLEAEKIERLPAPEELCLARLQESVGDLAEFSKTFGRWCDRDDSDADVRDHLELARQNQNQEDFDAALARADRATSLAPEDPDAWSLLAEFYRARNERENAAEAFERAAEVDAPSQSVGHLICAADCVRELDIVRAHTLLTRARELDPGAIDVHIALTRVASQREELEDTQQAAETTLELAHSTPIASEIQLEIAVMGGRAARQLGHRDAGRHLFESAIEVDADQIEALEGIAEAHYEDGDFSLARTPLEHRLTLSGENPQRARHQSMIARGLEAEDRLDQARSGYSEAIDLDSSLDEAHEGLVRVHERGIRLDEALDALERWAEMSGVPERKALASFRAAEYALAFEDAARARGCLDRATQADPEFAPAWLLLCQLVDVPGADEESRRVCNDALEALEAGPITAQISLRAARLSEAAGNNEQAIERYSDASRWESRCTEASLGESRLIRMAGDWTRADAVLAGFIDAHPDPESPTLARIHLERGRLLSGPLEDFDLAIAAYRRALTLQPDLQLAQTALAGLLLHSGERWREALAIHREILEASPTTVGSLRALAEIARQRDQSETEEGAITVLRAIGQASPQEAFAAPNGLRIPILLEPRMSDPEAERLRCIASQLREEIGDLLADAAGITIDCEELPIAEAIRQILSMEDELCAPNLTRLGPSDRKRLFSDVAALILDANDDDNDELRYRDALDRSVGWWARRKVRGLIEETSLAEIEAVDHEAWGEELRAMAAAQAIDRNGGNLRATLQALIVLGGDEPRFVPKGTEIGLHASDSESARRLLTRVITTLCERLEGAT